MKIPVSEIFANPNQPRKEFDRDKLDELAQSIKEHGLLEPVVLTPRNGRYMIIAGERRFRAHLIVGLTEIESNIIEADDAKVEELALLENIQRQDLNVMEEARAYKSLLDRNTIEELSRKLGIKVPVIEKRIALLNLTSDYQKLTASGHISPFEAYEMSKVPQSKQHLILKEIQAGAMKGYGKLKSFVENLLTIENQGAFFLQQAMSDEEKSILEKFEQSVSQVEKMLKVFHDAETMGLFEKATLHMNINLDRINLIVKCLMDVKRALHKSQALQKALKA
ncbi:MAG: ParB/RepB/Spo0J family partition protein [Thermodesulfovibrionales bacterium]